MQHVRAGAIVAKDGILPDLDAVLATHMRIHSAEGLFYRDVFREAWRIGMKLTNITGGSDEETLRLF